MTPYFTLSELPYIYLNQLFYVLSFVAAEFMFADASCRRTRFIPRILLSAIILLSACGVGTVTADILNGADFFVSISIYTMLSCVSIVILPLCFKQCAERTFYSVILGLIFQHITSRFVKILAIVTSTQTYSVLSLVILILINIAGFLVLWFAFAKNVSRDVNFQPNLKSSIIILALTFIILPMSLFEDRISETIVRIYCCIVEIVIGTGLILFQYIIYVTNKRSIAMAIEKHIAEEQLAKSKDFQHVIDVMNIKVHDLKHQIRELESGYKTVSERVLDELKEATAEYESFIDTGNAIINTVLTEKHYICLANKILLTVMLDGKAFDFMSAEDIYSLFGNTLDNAIYYLKGIEEENRFIRISCLEQGDNIISVRVENFFEDELNVDSEGLPITDKDDKMYHGFGVKSIRAVAEKYGGTAIFRVEDELFKVTVLLYRK